MSLELRTATRGAERTVVRVGTPVLLLASAIGALAVSLHIDDAAIPSFAFGSRVVLAVQVALILFYGALLLMVPLTRALFHGDLPIELSLKGARWTEGIGGLGDQISDRQTKAEDKALKAELEIKQDLEVLREELEGIIRTQDEYTDEALSRIAKLEKRSLGRG